MQKAENTRTQPGPTRTSIFLNDLFRRCTRASNVPHVCIGKIKTLESFEVKFHRDLLNDDEVGDSDLTACRMFGFFMTVFDPFPAKFRDALSHVFYHCMNNPDYENQFIFEDTYQPDYAKKAVVVNLNDKYYYYTHFDITQVDTTKESVVEQHPLPDEWWNSFVVPGKWKIHFDPLSFFDPMVYTGILVNGKPQSMFNVNTELLEKQFDEEIVLLESAIKKMGKKK